MARVTTVDGIVIDFNPDSVAVVTPGEASTGAVVYGPTQSALRISESPQGFLGRLSIAAKFARLTRPDGSPVWINGASASSLRAPVAGEYPPEAHTVVFTGPLAQAVRETPEAVRVALNAHGGTL